MQPNIIYFHTHDTGRWIEPYGAPVRSPGYRRFADRGVMFRNAHSVAPTCSPSRAGLLTGQCAHSAGMLGLVHRGQRLTDPQRHLARWLTEQGYTTALSGVQHEAPADEETTTLGYQEVLAHGTAADNAAAAVQFLCREHDRPFFLSVGMMETHRQARNPWPFAYPPVDADHVAPPAPLPSTPETRGDLGSFQGALSAVDAALDLIMATLDDRSLAERTIVLVTTDHGLPLPGRKGTLTDAGTGVLLMLAGPGLPQGRTVDAVVSHIDVVPTLCELAGVATPGWAEGGSLRPSWEGDTGPGTVFTETNHHVGYQPQRAVRTDRWSYIRRFDDAPRQSLADVDDSPTKDVLRAAGWGSEPVERERLYDLLLDPLEQHNLIDDPAHEQVANDLRARLDAWMARTHDPILAGPIPTPAGVRAASIDDMSPADVPAANESATLG